MARAKTAVKEASTKGVVSWQEELAAQATAAAAQEAHVGGGNMFSTSGGTLKFSGNELPDNQMAVVIVDSIIENVFYVGKFDPDEPANPACFAYGRDPETMVPHEDVILKQSEGCEGCPMNEWDSNPNGDGKACKNSRRLALISAGSLNEDGQYTPEDDVAHYEGSDLAFLRLPVTSVKGYAAYVKQVAAVHKRPPHGVLTRIWLEPDTKTQYKVKFECLGLVPDDYMPALMQRNKEAAGVIDFPYKPLEEMPAEKKKPVAKAVTKRKY